MAPNMFKTALVFIKRTQLGDTKTIEEVLQRMQELQLTRDACTLYLKDWFESLGIPGKQLLKVFDRATVKRNTHEFRKYLLRLHCAFSLCPEKKQVELPIMEEATKYTRWSRPAPRRSSRSRTRKGSPTSDMFNTRFSDLAQQVRDLTGIVQQVLRTQNSDSKETKALLQQILQAQKRQRIQ
jgi:hypothetical protein